MKSKHPSVLPILEKLVKDALAVKTLVNTHLYYPCLYISSEEHIGLIICAAEAFDKTNEKSALFHANSLYIKSDSLHYLVHIRDVKQETEKIPTSALFCNTEV